MLPTISLGFIVLSTFTVLIDAGILGALAWLWWRAPRHGRASSRWLDAGLFAIAGGLLGGRLSFALGNWAYFQNHLVEVFRLWEGGYALPGALGGTLLGVLAYCLPRREPLLPLLDELAAPALALSALGWAGCAAANCAAGLDVPPGSVPFAVNLPDLYGVVLPRLPTQFTGIALSLLALGYLASQQDKRWRAGVRYAVSMTLVSGIAFVITFMRGDDVPPVGSWRLDTISNGAMLIIAVVALVGLWAPDSAAPHPADSPTQTPT